MGKRIDEQMFICYEPLPIVIIFSLPVNGH